MIKYSLTLLFTLLAWHTHANDTLRIAQVACSEPVTFQTPYFVSPKNVKGESWNNHELFDKNKDRLRLVSTPLSIHEGDTITTDNTPNLRTFSFTLRTNRFAVGNLHFTGTNYHQIYANGQPISSQLRLLPGDTPIQIVTYNDAKSKYAFNCFITGKDLHAIEVNPKGKRIWTQQAMIAGPHYYSCSLSPTGQYYFYVIEDKNADNKATYQSFLCTTKNDKIIRTWNKYVNLNWIDHEDRCLLTLDNKEGKKDLFILEPTNGQTTLLCSDIPQGSFQMSPQQDYLIYTKNEEGLGDLPGTHRLYEPDDQMPGWRNRTALFLFQLKDKTMQRLTYGNESIFLSDISSDGKKLLLITHHFQCNRIPFSTATALEMDIQTRKVDTLFAQEPFIGSIQYAPNDKDLLVKASPWAFQKIGCEVSQDQIPNSFDYRLYLYYPSLKMAEPLLCGFAPSVDRVVWNHKNNTIYFSAEDGFNKSLYALQPSKKEVKKINLPFTYVQNWSISTEQKQPQLIAYGQSGNTARQSAIGAIGSKMKSFGPINFKELTEQILLPSCHHWNFKASRGDSIHNFYFLPGDFDANKQYPMIVYYYGGCSPTPQLLEGFWPLSALAAQGYVVLVLEPSGATGFGQEFAARHVNAWGDESSDDIIEGVKTFCKEHTFVNPQKIGCMGASYGGFMTQYLQTKTDIFAAAISHAGISNITGYWGGGYWGYTYGETAEYGNFPWSNPDLFVKHSPLYNADKIHTPLLLLHGTADTNVPTAQSQAMFTALRILNRPVAYVTFKDENHVLHDFQKRMTWQSIINAWFALWLKDEPLWWNTLYPHDEFNTTTNSLSK